MTPHIAPKLDLETGHDRNCFSYIRMHEAVQKRPLELQ